jgi:carbon-monoxide dehydrogenase medium subunit
MKPAPFEYRAPDSIDHALELLNEHGDTAKILAGGQSLVPAMNFRVVQPSMLIDLNRIQEMDYVHEEECLYIGAMTRERTLEFDEPIAKRSPLLHEAVPNIAHPQIRNRGTIGGSIVNADPAAELPVLMLALNARLKAQSVAGARWIDARDFFVGMFTTALEPNEILVEIEVPFLQPQTGWSFLEVAPRGWTRRNVNRN